MLDVRNVLQRVAVRRPVHTAVNTRARRAAQNRSKSRKSMDMVGLFLLQISLGHVCNVLLTFLSTHCNMACLCVTVT